MSDSSFIPGIFNYCDSWCERCSLSHRCSIYDPVPSGMDGDQATLLETLHDSLQEAMDILRVNVESKGIDWETFQYEAAHHVVAPPPISADQHTLIELSESYSNHAREWIRQKEAVLRDRGREFANQLELGMDVAARGEAMADALEIVQWYVFFIHAKTKRAIQSANEMTPQDRSEIQTDANGSAKAALIAIDRSLQGWRILLDRFPEFTNSIIDVLLPLKQLKDRMEREFKNARAFIRPGFDE